MQEQINNFSMLKVGTILHETYRIDGYLSSGGFGNTYVATNIEFEERIAIKEFFMKGVTQRDENQTTVSVSNAENHKDFLEQKEKFKKEARRLRKLKNDHIVSVHDLFEENGTAYYVMDYVDGENLAERLKRTGKPMKEEEVRELLPQILDALKTVHSTSIWHLDLKPANIMLTKDGQVKLIDFGASKQLNAKKGGATTSTAISYMNGYAPREQMEQNYDKFGPWTDIYALGATIYTLLTNKRPPLPTNIDDDMSEDKHLALPFPDGISTDIKDIVLAMMHTNKNQRPQNVEVIMSILSDSNQKEEAYDVSEETIIDPKRNGAKEEQKQDLIINEKTQIDTLNKGIEIKSESKKQIKTRLLIGLGIIFILGCVGWMIYHFSNVSSMSSTQQISDRTYDKNQKTGIVNESRLWLYNTLKSEGNNVGKDFAEFDSLMTNNAESRKWAFDKARELGYNVGKDYDEFEKLICPAQHDNKRKLYNALSAEYDLGSFEQFSKDVQDTVKCRKLYNAIKDEYFVPKFDEFSKLLGVATTSKGRGNNPSGKVIIKKQEIEKNRRKLYNSLSGKYDIGDYKEYYEKINDPIHCKNLYNAIKDEYFVPEFDEFSMLLGVKSVENLGSEYRRKLYTNLINDGFDLGSFKDFNRNMADKTFRRNIYYAAKEAGWEVPDYDQYEADMKIYRIGTKGNMKEVTRSEYNDFIKRHQKMK